MYAYQVNFASVTLLTCNCGLISGRIARKYVSIRSSGSSTTLGSTTYTVYNTISSTHDVSYFKLTFIPIEFVILFSVLKNSKALDWSRFVNTNSQDCKGT